MRFVLVLAGSLLAAAPALAEGAKSTCTDTKDGLGVSRIVEIDTTNGPLYGEMSKYQREESFLGPKEVVLTFDDGPLPRYTKRILDTLDKFCTKATFFYVGEMAVAYPDMVKDVVARGHTLGAHTWSHPLNLKRLSLDRAKSQIERGFAAVSLAAGQDIAPFFRFPGLSDSNPLLAYLQTKGIASFTVDVVSNDSFISSAKHLTSRTLRLVEANNGGILLFHDIKSSTARALPDILAGLKAKGYKVVHMKPKAMMPRITDYDDILKPKIAKNTPKKTEDDAEPHALVPNDMASDKMASDKDMTAQQAATEAGDSPTEVENDGPPVTRIEPPARTRAAEKKSARPNKTAVESLSTSSAQHMSPKRPYAKKKARYKKKSQELGLFDFGF